MQSATGTRHCDHQESLLKISRLSESRLLRGSGSKALSKSRLASAATSMHSVMLSHFVHCQLPVPPWPILVASSKLHSGEAASIKTLQHLHLRTAYRTAVTMTLRRLRRTSKYEQHLHHNVLKGMAGTRRGSRATCKPSILHDSKSHHFQIAPSQHPLIQCGSL